MTLRVAQIPYLHSEPFYFDMARRGVELRELTPDVVADAMAQGEIDAAPVPLVDAFHLEDRTDPVAGFCVATKDKARSVLLHSSRPIEELGGATIGVSKAAGTSFQLLQVILQQRYQVFPAAFVGLNDQYDAFLVTDDDALRRRWGGRSYTHGYDLGQEWFSWTHLPFVFSRWVVRKDTDPGDVALLEDTLYVGLEEGVDSLIHLAEPREDLLMLPRHILEYIMGYRYFIGAMEQRAIDHFRQCLEGLRD